jgi:hypothetical protein
METLKHFNKLSRVSTITTKDFYIYHTMEFGKRVQKMSDEREVIGIVEEVTVKGSKGEKRIKAKIDTGADRTSVDADLAAEVGLGPIHDTIKVKSSLSGQSQRRLVVQAEIIVRGEHHTVSVSIGDRSNMKYDVIVGKDVLRDSKFLIDPTVEED